MQRPDAKVDSDGVQFMSVDDTNALRASLGLQPLNVGSAPSPASSEAPGVGNESSDASSANADVQRIRERILLSRRKRRELRLRRKKTLGEDPVSEDVFSWTKTLGANPDVSDDPSEAQPAAAQPQYDSTALAGATIRHSLSSIRPGEEITLTLRDTSVLDDVDDDIDGVEGSGAQVELENDALIRAEKAEFRQRLKSEKRLDPAAFEKEKEREGSLFRLNEDMVRADPDEPETDASSAEPERAATDTWGLGIGGESAASTASGGPPVVRRRKKKKRQLRRKRKKNQSAVGSDAASGQPPAQPPLPPPPRKFNPATFLIPGMAPPGSFKIDSLPPPPIAAASAVPLPPPPPVAPPSAESSLQAKKKGRRKKKNKKKKKKKAAMVFDDVNEFCRTLAIPKVEAAEPARIKRRRRKKKLRGSTRKSEGRRRKEESLELQKRAAEAASAPTTVATGLPPTIVKDEGSASSDPHSPSAPASVKSEGASPSSGPIIEDEELCSVDFGIASALRFVRQKRLLAAVRPGYEEDEEDRRVVRRTTTEDGVVLNEINIEYHDSYGRRVENPHKAFKLLCHGFHGVKPGKNRREKEQRKIVEEQRRKEMGLADTPLDGVAQLRHIQEETESFFVKYSGNISDLTVAATNKRRARRKKRRKRKRKDSGGGRARKRRKIQDEGGDDDEPIAED